MRTRYFALGLLAALAVSTSALCADRCLQTKRTSIKAVRVEKNLQKKQAAAQKKFDAKDSKEKRLLRDLVAKQAAVATAAAAATSAQNAYQACLAAPTPTATPGGS